MPQWADFLPGGGSSGGGGLLQSLINPIKGTTDLLGSLTTSLTGGLNHLTGLASNVLNTTVGSSFGQGRTLLDNTLTALSVPDQSRLTETLSNTVAQVTTAPFGAAAAALNPGNPNIGVSVSNLLNAVPQALGNVLGGLTQGNPLPGVEAAVQTLTGATGAALNGLTQNGPLQGLGTPVQTLGTAVNTGVQNTVSTLNTAINTTLPSTSQTIPITQRGDISLVYNADSGISRLLVIPPETGIATHADEPERRTAPPPPPEVLKPLEVDVELRDGIARFNLAELERAAGRTLLTDMATLLKIAALREGAAAPSLTTLNPAMAPPVPNEMPQGFVPQVKMRDDPFPYADIYTPSKPREYVQSAADRDAHRASTLQDLLREAIRRFYAMRPPTGSIGDRLGFDSNGAFVQSLAHNDQQAIEIRVIRDQMQSLGMQDAKMERLLLLQEHLSDHALEYSTA